MNKYSAIVVGCGSIGALKPDKYDGPDTENMFTLAHALHEHPQVEIIGFVDTDKDKVERACAKWGVTNAMNLSMFPADIVVISTHTENHLQVLEDVCRAVRSRVIDRKMVVLLEKPAGISPIDVGIVPSLVTVGVDYTRRYSGAFQRLAKTLRGEKVHSCVVHYNRGLYRDGCHAIDLFHWFFGEMNYKRVLGIPILDYSDTDPTEFVHMEFERCPHVLMVPVDGREICLFGITVVADSGRYTVTDDGVSIEYAAKSGSAYGDYDTISSLRSYTYATDMEIALFRYVREAVQVLDGEREQFSCTLNDSNKVHETIQRIRGARV